MVSITTKYQTFEYLYECIYWLLGFGWNNIQVLLWGEGHIKGYYVISNFDRAVAVGCMHMSTPRIFDFTSKYGMTQQYYIAILRCMCCQIYSSINSIEMCFIVKHTMRYIIMASNQHFWCFCLFFIVWWYWGMLYGYKRIYTRDCLWHDTTDKRTIEFDGNSIW